MTERKTNRAANVGRSLGEVVVDPRPECPQRRCSLPPEKTETRIQTHHQII